MQQLARRLPAPGSTQAEAPATLAAIAHRVPIEGLFIAIGIGRA
ncbi:hypothetical protein PQR05_17485 [Paraburkholderia sediminicola]